MLFLLLTCRLNWYLGGIWIPGVLVLLCCELTSWPWAQPQSLGLSLPICILGVLLAPRAARVRRQEVKAAPRLGPVKGPEWGTKTCFSPGSPRAWTLQPESTDWPTANSLPGEQCPPSQEEGLRLEHRSHLSTNVTGECPSHSAVPSLPSS